MSCTRDQLCRLLWEDIHPTLAQSDTQTFNSDEIVLRSLLTAFPDRLVRRRERGSDRGVMVGGKGVRLAPSSGVLEPELFLAVNVDASSGEIFVRQASAVERNWLPTERVTTKVEVYFDESSERVEATRLRASTI